MRNIIVQPCFATIDQPYGECLKELPPPSDLIAANLLSAPHEQIVLTDERSSKNLFRGPGFVSVIENAGTGNTYGPGTALLMHCDRKQVVGINDCFLMDEDLKKYTWLFDHVVWPTTTCGTNIGELSPLAGYLLSKGLLSRHQYNVSDEMYLGNKFFKLFVVAFKRYEQLKEGYASIAQHRNDFYLPSSYFPKETRDRMTAQIRLQNALPVPGENVPMEDILEFKIKNYDLLNRLMRHIDGIYLKLLEDGPDVIRRNNWLIAGFEEQIKEVLDEMKKSSIRRALSSITVQYKLPLTLAGLVAGVGHLADVPLELGAILGALAGSVASRLTIEITPGAGFLGKEERLEPLAYLSLGARSFQLDPPPSTAGAPDGT